MTAGQARPQHPYFDLVHFFEVAGRHYLVDGSTGALVRLDADAYGSWREYLETTRHAKGAGLIAASPASATPPASAELLAAGLFRRPAYPACDSEQDDGHSASPMAEGLHSLCLNMAHACDLRCTYCFADGGSYGRAHSAVEHSLMTPAVARHAVDYLLANAPPGRTVNIDFFGGEPLLAWETIVSTVEHARRRASTSGHAVHFTLTTNAVEMTARRAAFCAEHMATLIVSIDGRPAVHDRMRRTAGGGPSFKRSVAGAQLLKTALASRAPADSATLPRGHLLDRPDRPTGSGPLWVRGTFTRYNLDFWRDVEYLSEMGFTQISIEPVSASAEQPYAIAREDLGAISESYRRIASMVRSKPGLRFFHFELNSERPACAAKRYTGCAAGAGYGCVTPTGELYPCHQFDGCRGFSQGNIAELVNYPRHARLAAAHVGAKAACRECWAQLYCGGGCHYAAWRYGDGLLRPPPLLCDLTKTRLEWALDLHGTAPPSRGSGSPVA